MMGGDHEQLNHVYRSALNIFSAPAGNTVVGEVPAYQRVYLMDGSLLRDWVFIGKPGETVFPHAVG